MKKSKLSCISLFLIVLMLFSISVFVKSEPVRATSIGEWKFDEGTGLIANDSSSQEKTGRLWGAVQWVEGIINKAIQFTGSTDYVQVAPSIQNSTSWSFTAYVKPTGNQGAEQYIYSERDVNGDVYFYICITDDRRIKVATRHYLRAGELNNHSPWDSYQTNTDVISSGDWNNLMITFSGGSITPGSGTVKCFVNGRKVGEGKLGPSTKTPVLSLTGITGASWTVGTSPALTRLGDNAGRAVGEAITQLYPWSQIKTETINGQQMVKIPKFYYKHTYSGGKHQIYIADHHYLSASELEAQGFKLHPAFSRGGVEKPYILVGTNKFGQNQTMVECRLTAQSYGTGWGIMDIQTWSAIQMLQLVEYANTSGSTNYRGLNGLYSEAGQFIDGLISKNGTAYIGSSNTGFALPSGAGYIIDWHYSSSYDWLFLPKGDVSGSNNTGIPSTFRKTSGETVAVGGCSWWHCDCSNYCNYCYLGQHGFCNNSCSCLCSCHYIIRDASGYRHDYGCGYNGSHDYCYDHDCGRPAGSSLGLFSWACRLSTATASPHIGARLQYIP